MLDLEQRNWESALQELTDGLGLPSKSHHCSQRNHSASAHLARKLAESYISTLSLSGYYKGAGSEGISRLSTSPDSERADGEMDGTGRRKRRRNDGPSWSKMSPALDDDGYSWRKYGQKEILGSAFPRGYFRCTHRHDQGCLITKQVQKISSDPPVYEILYRGIHHTCKNTDDSRKLSCRNLDGSHSSGPSHGYAMGSI